MRHTEKACMRVFNTSNGFRATIEDYDSKKLRKYWRYKYKYETM